MSPTRNGIIWAGCHGVRTSGDSIELGASAGVPLAFATIRYGEVAPPEGSQLWSQNGEAAVLSRRVDGRFVLASPRAAALEVDPRDASITVAPGDDAVQRQLVASFGLPLLLHGLDVLLVHGSACARDDRAIVVCADSGSGKSSTLVRLIDHGWESLSEDVCTIDLRDPQHPRVWPGPPWVRVAHGEPGPAAATRAFESEDKTAWDTSAIHAAAPVDLARVVVLDAPGGGAPVIELLARAEALRAIARHAVWLQEPADRGRRLFPPVATVVAQVPVVRVRLPHDDAWRESIPDVVKAALAT
jgi:hypothetical protein